jgi:hypothetical protein
MSKTGGIKMLKIKQTYHGNGGREGYRYRVYKNDKKVGELKNLPTHVGWGSILSLDSKLYQVINEYDDNTKPYSTLETVWYELEEYEFQDYTVIEWKK